MTEYTVKQLKETIKKHKENYPKELTKGYSRMRKDELIKVLKTMMKYNKKKDKKEEPKKEEPIEEEPIEEEPIEEEPKYNYFIAPHRKYNLNTDKICGFFEDRIYNTKNDAESIYNKYKKMNRIPSDSTSEMFKTFDVYDSINFIKKTGEKIVKKYCPDGLLSSKYINYLSELNNYIKKFKKFNIKVKAVMFETIYKGYLREYKKKSHTGEMRDILSFLGVEKIKDIKYILDKYNLNKNIQYEYKDLNILIKRDKPKK